jgi:hypothetical protein
MAESEIACAIRYLFIEMSRSFFDRNTNRTVMLKVTPSIAKNIGET